MSISKSGSYSNSVCNNPDATFLSSLNNPKNYCQDTIAVSGEKFSQYENAVDKEDEYSLFARRLIDHYVPNISKSDPSSYSSDSDVSMDSNSDANRCSSTESMPSPVSMNSMSVEKGFKPVSNPSARYGSKTNRRRQGRPVKNLEGREVLPRFKETDSKSKEVGTVSQTVQLSHSKGPIDLSSVPTPSSKCIHQPQTILSCPPGYPNGKDLQEKGLGLAPCVIQ